MKIKFCNICKENKPITEFYKRNDRKCGVQSTCKSCQSKNSSMYGLTHLKEKLNNLMKWKKQNPKRYWGNKTINHHKEAGYIVKITNDELFNYIKDKDYCELCDKKLEWFNKKTAFSSPTLDRLNNENIVSINNVQLICHECNTTKGTKTQKEFIAYCKLIAERHGEI